jgi:hypothetical protein
MRIFFALKKKCHKSGLKAAKKASQQPKTTAKKSALILKRSAQKLHSCHFCAKNSLAQELLRL